MAEPDPNELRTALLKWVQAFTPQVPSLFDLRDGHALYSILLDIDSEYFNQHALPAESLQETAFNWIPRWQNLKHIQKVVSTYVRDVCGVLDANAEDAIRVADADLKSWATQREYVSETDTAVLGLLKGILRAAMFSPVSNQRMGKRVLDLGSDTAQIIAGALAAMEVMDDMDDSQDDIDTTEADEQSSIPPGQDTDHARSDPFNSRSSDYEQEERLIKAHRAIRQLEAVNAQLMIEVDGLRKAKVELQQGLESFKYEVNNTESRNATAQALQDLRTKATSDRDYIADLESDLASTRATMETYERQLERFKTDGDTKQTLRDEVQLLKAERDDLAQRTRAVDNLKKKIQILQDQDKHNHAVREDLRTAQEQIQELDTLRERCERLSKANAEKQNILSNTEQEIFDQKTIKKRLEHDLKVAMQKLEAARDRQAKDQETIAGLEKQIAQEHEVEGQVTPASDSSGRLESEMQAAERSARPVSPSLSSRDWSAEIEVKVEERMAPLNDRIRRLESEYLGMLQEKLGLETVISELRGTLPSPLEDNLPYMDQRQRLESAHNEIDQLRKAYHTLTVQLAAAQEKAHATHLSPTLEHSRRGSKAEDAWSDSASIATHESRIDIKADFQALTKNYAELMRHAEEKETQVTERQNLLRHALLTKQAVLLENAESRRSAEHSLIMEQLQMMRDDENLSNIAALLSDQIESARVAATAAQQVTRDRDTVIAALEQEIVRLKADHETKGDSAERRAVKQEIKLMRSAWVDLQTRLQTTDVTISKRRNETPKSWIMRQRIGVGLGGGRVTRVV